jgi:hypothetical protein
MHHSMRVLPQQSITVVQEQMQERFVQLEQARAEHERERAMVDAVMAAIDEEDRLQGELKRRKAAETVEYINEFVADRERRRAEERRSEFNEERKIQVLQLHLLACLGRGQSWSKSDVARAPVSPCEGRKGKHTLMK